MPLKLMIGSIVNRFLVIPDSFYIKIYVDYIITHKFFDCKYIINFHIKKIFEDKIQMTRLRLDLFILSY